MQVIGITPWLSDTFTRTASSGWGTADTGQGWSIVGGSASDFAVSAGVDTITLTTVSATRRSFIDTTYTDFDYYIDITTSATATGGSIFGGPTGRYIDSSNLYTARMEFTTANTLILTLRKVVNGTETALGTYTLPDTYVAGTYYRIRLQAQGALLRAKAWAVSAVVETPEWQITASDDDITTTAFFGTRSNSASANTNVNPVVSYDNAAIVNPQTFTVTRSVNGVIKAHSAGEDLRLANPTYFAL